MTNIQAILKADECKRNTIDAEVKCAWLTEVDQTIYHHILATHEGELPVFPQYALNEEKELLAPPPYDALYVKYIIMKIDEVTQELAKYNRSAALFAEAYQSYADWYNRTHMPVQRGELKV